MHAQRWPRLNHSSHMEEQSAEDERELREPAPYPDIPDVSDPIARIVKKAMWPLLVSMFIAALIVCVWSFARGR